MKKQLLALFTVFALFFTMGSFVSADQGQVTNEMKQTIEKGLKDKHSDLKKGTLSISKVESFENSDSKIDASEIVVGIANFETVRDNIFYFDHNEYVFYNPDKNEMLNEGQVAKANPKIQEYKDANMDSTGTHMDFVVILLLLALIVIVPLLLMIVWEKRQYLTTKFKIENNLLNQDKLYR